APRWEVRAYFPGAIAVAVVMDRGEVIMEQRHPEGFFVASMDGSPCGYMLRRNYPNGVTQVVEDPYRFPPLITDYDIHLHAEGTLEEAWQMLGAHPMECEGVAGVRFSVWAPSANTASVSGDFNLWNSRMHPMRLPNGGIWELFRPGVARGDAYKFAVTWKNGYQQLKSDPYAFRTEVPPQQASLVCGPPQHKWEDQEWMQARG